jgi:hypothetical protein
MEASAFPVVGYNCGYAIRMSSHVQVRIHCRIAFEGVFGMRGGRRVGLEVVRVSRRYQQIDSLCRKYRTVAYLTYLPTAS